MKSRYWFLIAWAMAISTQAGTDCSVSSLPDLNFGSYSPYSVTELDITSTATITCTTNSNNDFVTLTMSISRGGAPSFSPRQMRNSSNGTLDYNLYTSAARSAVFGDGSGGSSVVTASGVARKTAPFVTSAGVYGRVFAGQDPAVGGYVDTLVFTVMY